MIELLKACRAWVAAQREQEDVAHAWQRAQRAASNTYQNEGRAAYDRVGKANARLKQASTVLRYVIEKEYET